MSRNKNISEQLEMKEVNEVASLFPKWFECCWLHFVCIILVYRSTFDTDIQNILLPFLCRCNDLTIPKYHILMRIKILLYLTPVNKLIHTNKDKST